MKNHFVIFLFLITSGIGFAQNNYIVKTEDGRRVLLKADYTWEYIDAEPLKPYLQKRKFLNPLKTTDVI